MARMPGHISLHAPRVQLPVLEVSAPTCSAHPKLRVAIVSLAGHRAPRKVAAVISDSLFEASTVLDRPSSDILPCTRGPADHRRIHQLKPRSRMLPGLSISNLLGGVGLRPSWSGDGRHYSKVFFWSK